MSLIVRGSCGGGWPFVVSCKSRLPANFETASSIVKNNFEKLLNAIYGERLFSSLATSFSLTFMDEHTLFLIMRRIFEVIISAPLLFAPEINRPFSPLFSFRPTLSSFFSFFFRFTGHSSCLLINSLLVDIFFFFLSTKWILDPPVYSCRFKRNNLTRRHEIAKCSSARRKSRDICTIGCTYV